MPKPCVTFLFFSLLMVIPLHGQDVFVSGDNQAAMQVKSALEKSTHYRLSGGANNTILLVNEISWSPDFVTPVTTAIQMKLISTRGALLWSKTEPVGSRPKDEVIQGLLKDLAQAKPDLGGTAAKAPEAHQPTGKNK